ncbi:CCN family member 5-like [Brachyhypopomus gauderio]|uniref:CCN family member 5-like n=1 Tax=Brachyhypopomus gauderio TaxID=698409 RepID=UPI004042BC11
MKTETRKAVFTGSLLFCILTQVACQLCGGRCQCRWFSPSCPVGVPLVLDGCQCCQMCARQEGEPCSERHVCDTQQGLQCDYSASFPGGPGECVRQNELGCELAGVRYKEGQSFQPTCMQLCNCSGGGITCVPLCNEDLSLTTALCPDPRLVQVPGGCCKEWVCEGTDNSIHLEHSAVITAEQVIGSQQKSPVSSGVPWANCIEQSTEWSACSHSCGPGVSTRMSNRNWACRLQTQTRLCQVRPCHPATSEPTSRVQLGMGMCETSYRPTLPLRLQHQGCYSVHSYRPLFCGTCSDSRCCTPHQTRTIGMDFHCPQGDVVHHWFMMIQSCVCHYHCPQLPLASSRRKRRSGLKTWLQHSHLRETGSNFHVSYI